MTLPFPQLGDALPPTADSAMLDRLARRRSTPAQTLRAPGPDRDQTDALIRLAARAPDHGKLAPWRFIVIEPAPKAALVERLKAVAAIREDADQATAKLGKLSASPLTVVVVSRTEEGLKVPVWEQELSAGAVCHNFLLAADAMGFGANWITDWYAYDSDAVALLGLDAGEKVAGFMHVGTPAEAPLERARPDVAGLVSYLGA